MYVCMLLLLLANCESKDWFITKLTKYPIVSIGKIKYFSHANN